MRILLLSLGSWAVVALAGCGGSEFSAANGGVTGGGTGSGTGGSNSSGSTTGSGGRTGAGGKGVGGSGTGGTATGGTGVGGTATGGSGTGGTAAGGIPGTGGSAAGGAPGSGGVGTGGSGGSPTNSGDCRPDHNDCGSNSRCVEVTPGGYRVCTVPYPPVTSCSGVPQQCCSSADCNSGSICYAAPLAPNCGGIIAFGSNVCSSDVCTSDSACGSGSICVPAGTMDRKVRMCVPADCHRDTDCIKAPGGICAPVTTGCCNGTTGLYCVYPGGCRSNKDCASGNCELDQTGAAACASGPAICPA